MARVPIEELRNLTDATHNKKVCRRLAYMGIPYKLHENGEPVVLRSALDRAFGEQQPTAVRAAINIDERLDRLKETNHGKKAHQRPGTSG